MRILQVSPFYSPRMGGSAQVVYQTSKHLAMRGHQVSLLAGDFGIQDAQFPPVDNFQPTLLPSLISKCGFYLTPALIPWAKKHLHRFDLIHLHELRTFQNIVVKHYSIKNRIPYVLSSHGALSHLNQKKFVKRIFDRCFGNSLLSNAGRLIAVSETESRQYTALLLPGDRIHVIPNGLDLHEYSHLPGKGRFRGRFRIGPGNPKIVLYLGRLHRQKGLLCLLQAFAHLKSGPVDCILAIVGPDHGELIHIRRHIARLKIGDRVLLAGPLYGPDKLAALVDADVLAYPAQGEIFGLVPFEALMCGTPVVVSEGCGLGELIRQAGAGYLVPHADSGALAHALQRALVHPRESREQVGAGRAFIRQHLDWNRVILDLETVYAAALNPFLPSSTMGRYKRIA